MQVSPPKLKDPKLEAEAFKKFRGFRRGNYAG